MLDLREYGLEMTRAEASQAAKDGLIVAFGGSDDLLKFRGVIEDEIGTYNGIRVHLARFGECLEPINGVETPTWIESEWRPEDCTPDLSCIIHTNLPCATFLILDHGKPFCRGVVIDQRSIGAMVPTISSAEWSAVKAILTEDDDDKLRTALVAAAMTRAQSDL